MYICLEGLKGCGKSTLLTSAQRLLTAQRVPFSVVAPTRAIPAALSWQERLSAQIPCLRRSDAWTERLYALRARYAAAPAKWQLPLVLGDRCIITSYATRWRKWGHPQQCIERVNRLEAQVPVPDHIILLDVDPEVARERAIARQRCYGQHDESLPRLQQARDAYHQIAAFGIPRLAHTQWHVLNANQAPQAVFQDWLTLMNRLAPASFSTPLLA